MNDKNVNDEYDLNNFHGWFPDGFYRGFKNVKPKDNKLIADLDQVLEEMGFNLERFNYLKFELSRILKEVVDLYKKVYNEENREMTLEERKGMKN
jgi:hypothetical protein